MTTPKATVFLSGKLYWAKILGKPVPNYSRDGFEWTLEFEPDADGLRVLKAHKLTDRLKDKHEDRGKYITLKQNATRKDGTENQPIRVYDNDNNAWDQTTLIGNGSEGDVKLDIRDYGVGKKKGIYPIAVRVKNLVQYQSSEFGAMDGTNGAPQVDPKFAADLDDDLPF